MRTTTTTTTTTTTSSEIDFELVIERDVVLLFVATRTTTTTSATTTLPPVQIISPSDIIRNCEQPLVIGTLASTVVVGIVCNIALAVFVAKTVAGFDRQK